MTASWTSDERPLDVIELVRVLAANGVRYVFVGGIAAMAHGWSGTTLDADVVPATDDSDLERLAGALRDLDAEVYADPARRDLRADGAPPEADELDLGQPATLRNRLTWALSTRAGRVDVLFVIEGAGGHRELARGAAEVTVSGTPVLVASLEDIIDSKATVGRDKDLAVLGELRRLLDERGGA